MLHTQTHKQASHHLVTLDVKVDLAGDHSVVEAQLTM